MDYCYEKTYNNLILLSANKTAISESTVPFRNGKLNLLWANNNYLKFYKFPYEYVLEITYNLFNTSRCMKPYKQIESFIFVHFTKQSPIFGCLMGLRAIIINLHTFKIICLVRIKYCTISKQVQPRQTSWLDGLTVYQLF